MLLVVIFSDLAVLLQCTGTLQQYTVDTIQGYPGLEVKLFLFTWYHSGVVGRSGIPSPQPPRVNTSDTTCAKAFKEWLDDVFIVAA